MSAVDNMLALLDGWFKFKAEQLAKEAFQVHLHPHVGVNVAGDDFDWIVEDHGMTLPLGFFEAQPVVGKRTVTLHVEIVDGDSVNILLAGNTWTWRTKLDSLNVAGAYHEDEAGGQKSYYRVLKGLNCSDKSRLFDLLGDACFKKLAMRLVVGSPEPDPASAAAVFLSELREMPQLHAVKA